MSVNIYNYYSCTGLLQADVNNSSSAMIQVHQEENFSLQVKTTNAAVVKYLLELTWYHNGSVIVPDERTTLSNKNKTLSITNFTTFDAGVYVVQFNKLFSYPYNDDCNKEVISLLRNSPMMKPVVFCVNMGSECHEEAEKQRVSLQSVKSGLLETFQSISLEAIGTVHNSICLLYTSPSPRDATLSRMPSSA